MRIEKHFSNRSNWLRAAVLGANDGILSTTSIAIGVAAASTTRDPILLATIAGIVAGAMSMAAGEYVSVSSQSDVESSDLKREAEELRTMPEEELAELAEIYHKRGLTPELSKEVARQLMAHNALEAHARDELGINEITTPKPFQAALASALSFISGGILPLLISIWGPIKNLIYFQYGFAIVFLAISGSIAAAIGGSNVLKSVFRITLWGTAAMVVSGWIGYIFGVNM